MARIVVLAGYAPSLILFRRQLLASMIGAGHEVWALAPDLAGNVAATLAAMGVRCASVELDRTSYRPHRAVIELFRLWRRLKALAPDILLTYTAKPVIFGSLAGRWAGLRNIHAIVTGLGFAFSGDSWRQQLLRACLRPLYRRALAHNRLIIFQNPDDLAQFRQEGILDADASTIVINGSGVDLGFFAEKPLPTVPLTFLLIARLLREKGIVEYAEAAQSLKGHYPDVRFRLLGPIDSNPGGVDASWIEKVTGRGALEYMGAVEDVRPHIAASSVLVLPSYREGTPHAVLEAMAMGRPIVTTDVPGCRETVVEGRNGFLVPPRDVAKLAAAMEWCILNGERLAEMGRESRRLAEGKYDVHEVNGVILNALGLCGEKNH